MRGMQLSRKQWIRVAGALLTLVSFARVAVLFFEAVAQVRDERAQDVELLELCQQGAARGSFKMRAACVAAQAERASPLLFKAVIRAVSNAFSEFQESCSTPAKFGVVALFLLSSVMPLTAWVRALIPTDDVEGDNHVVVLAHDPASSLGVKRAAWKRAIGAMRSRKAVAFHEDASAEDDSFTALEVGESREKMD